MKTELSILELLEECEDLNFSIVGRNRDSDRARDSDCGSFTGASALCDLTGEVISENFEF